MADDDPAIRKLLGGVLKMAGYDVREAEDGTKAVVLCESLAAEGLVPEVITMDYHMPGLDGNEVLATDIVRSNTTAVKLMVTGQGKQQNESPEAFKDRIMGMAESGLCDALVTKPFELMDLKNQIIEMVDAKKLTNPVEASEPEASEFYLTLPGGEPISLDDLEPMRAGDAITERPVQIETAYILSHKIHVDALGKADRLYPDGLSTPEGASGRTSWAAATTSSFEARVESASKNFADRNQSEEAQKPRVFIVDLDPGAVRILSELYKAEGYDVTTAHNTQEYNANYANGFDLLVMGGKFGSYQDRETGTEVPAHERGADTLVKISANSGNPLQHTNKILYSGGNIDEAKKIIADAGVEVDVIRKPAEQRDLFRRSNELTGHTGKGVELVS